jgi:ParG
VRAISSLPPADRDRVYLWLLRQQQITVPHAEWIAQLRAPVAGLPRGPLREGRAATGALRQAGVASGQQMVPVRFSSEQHAQLRRWCAEHGFSMATVIRGLVTRFLEGQSPPQREQSP